MATMDELRDRTQSLFSELLAPTATQGQALVAEADPGSTRAFRWFDPADAAAAAELSAELAVVSAAADSVDDGLARALDRADERLRTDPPGLVAQALALFITHHRPARQLARPRTLRAAPSLFAPSRGAVAGGARLAEGPPDPAAPGGERTDGSEAVLDYWREDPFPNEHHSHWHQVYPFAGLLPQDWIDWAARADRAGLASLFTALDPTQDWPAFLAASTTPVIARRFIDVANAHPDLGTAFRQLPALAYRTLFRLNDRQGELFFYMHAQMLARYDAERLSHGMNRVEPFGPEQWALPIPESYDPGPALADYTARAPDQTLPDAQVTRLRTWHSALTDPQLARGLVDATGAQLPVTSDRLGDATEASDFRLTGLSNPTYPGTHNIGHNFIGGLSPDHDGDGNGDGVMIAPAVAIRDPVFWRWHRYIDELNTTWQDQQQPYPTTDAPPVVLRNAVTASPDDAAAPWSSPDILLVATSDLPPGTDAAAAMTTAVGGDRFDTDIAPGALADAPGMVVVDELTTTVVESALSDGTAVQHLSHEPFALVVRVANTTDRPAPVTLRSFLAPATDADDRRMWIELDKVLVELPPNGRVVVYRPDTEFSVVKKPAETDPQSVLDGAADPDDPNYCDCGWPYTLLLPRGTQNGMAFRLAVIATDGTTDLLRPSAECGSMSFCGAVDRYPDTRDMGYPFSRPFATSITTTFLHHPAATARTLTIRHTTNP